MNFKYRELNTQEEIDQFFNNKCIQIRELKNDNDYIIDWYKKDGIKIYGYFYNDIDILICYGQTILPDNNEQQSKVGIFTKLHNYGSSKEYLGIKDLYGKTLLPNNYEEINFFYETDCSSYFTIKNKGKVGVFQYNTQFVGIIVPTKYDSIFDAHEYTWGYIINGNVGFMTINGKKITEAKYINKEGFNIFFDGKALIQLNKHDTCKAYIDHYDNIIGFYQEECQFCSDGTEYYPFGELPDDLDAYEGDTSNYWNTY